MHSPLPQKNHNKKAKSIHLTILKVLKKVQVKK